jgi:TonB-dependent receptor
MQTKPFFSFRGPGRLLGRLLLLVLATVALRAQSTGSLSGRVTDAASGLSLAGARVSAGGRETFTNQSGGYELALVPAGPQQVEISYVGYAPLVREVTVNGSTALNVIFNETTVKLDKMVITGSLVGSARAINQQRAAETLRNIVAADEIGRFPDQNAAESLQRIPGLALYRDQGEGRFIVVRGIKPDLNAVQLNGVSVASPERGDRTVALDVLPTDAFGAVEVTKVPTPDLPADGIGGTINLKTRSAFDAEGRQLQLNLQGQYSDLRERYSGKVSGTYADVFRNGTVGVILSPTWQKRTFGSFNYEEDGGWSLKGVPGSTSGQQEYFFNGLAFRQYVIERTRYGLNSAVEFKPDATTLYYLRATYSRFEDVEQRYVSFIPFNEGTLTQLDSQSATVTGVRRERRDIRIREKDQDISSLVAGGERRLGDWRVDGRIARSQGQEERPAETTVRFRKSARATNWSYSFADGLYRPVVNQTAGVALADPANASAFNEISRFRVVDSPGEETEWNYAVNARRDFTVADGRPAYVKLGAQFRQKEKIQANETVDYAVPSTFNYAAVVEPQTDYPYYGGTRASAERILAALAGGGFTPSRLLVESETADWNSDEDVLGLYAMGGVTAGRLNVVAGARHERTRFSSRGNELTNGTVVTPVSRARTYDNFLPGVYLRYDLDRDTVVRASWSNALTRPAFDESAVSRTVNTTVTPGQVTQGNPGLKPLEAVNWDLSVERYLPSLGVVSAGVFYKDIKNFTYQRLIPGGDAATGYDLTTFVNGDTGHIAGLELAYQQQFRSLPSPFDGLGVMANFTWTSSSATYPSRPGETLAFIGQSPTLGNVAVSYEKAGLFVRLALNFRDPRLREDEPLGTDAATDRWVDEFHQLDLSASYRLTPKIELFAEGLNLTNEPFRVHFGQYGRRLAQFEEYGWSANFGVRLKL